MYRACFRVCLIILVATALGRSIFADDATDTIDETLLAKLQGEWRTVSSVLDGKPFTSPARGWKMVISGRTMSLKSGDNVIGRLEIKHVAAHEEFGHIDYELADPAGKAIRTKQLFKLEGDTLTTCVRTPPGERPSELKSEAGSHLLLTVAQRDKTEAAHEDEELLQGLWQAVSLEANGKQAPEEEVKNFQLLFRDDKLVVKAKQEQDREYAYAIDQQASPKALDLIRGDGPTKGERTPCAIYELTGDKLVICIDEYGKLGKRPTKFKTEADDGTSLFTLERRKQTN